MNKVDQMYLQIFEYKSRRTIESLLFMIAF